MKFGQGLEKILVERNETQEVPARIANVSRSTIGKYNKGTRKIPKDVMKSISTHYDEAQLFLTAAYEVTDGAFVPWLNNVDLHRSSTHLKAIEETQEALESFMTISITKKPDQINEKERNDIKLSIFEAMEAITALTHHVAVLCKEYGFSYLEMWRQHRQELKGKRYIT